MPARLYEPWLNQNFEENVHTPLSFTQVESSGFVRVNCPGVSPALPGGPGFQAPPGAALRVSAIRLQSLTQRKYDHGDWIEVLRVRNRKEAYR